MMIKKEIASAPAALRNDKERNGNDKKMFSMMLILAVLLMVGGTGMAAETTAGSSAAVKPELPYKMEEVSGKIIAMTNYTISLETALKGSSSEEMILPYNKKKTQLKGYRHYSEIRRGDVIKSIVKKSYDTDAEGKEVLAGTEAIKITLVKNSTDGKLASY